MLCTTVEDSLFEDVHLSYEDDDNVLKKGLLDLAEKGGESFQFDMSVTEEQLRTTYIQFYN